MGILPGMSGPRRRDLKDLSPQGQAAAEWLRRLANALKTSRLYLPDNVIAEFERRYDAKINVELYDSNEALLAKLQSGGATFDIVVPSDYMVTILKGQGLIEEIDRDPLTNFAGWT